MIPVPQQHVACDIGRDIYYCEDVEPRTMRQAMPHRELM